MQTTYKTRDDHACMGLNNQLCTNIKYYCRSKRVYLSDEDVGKKRCLCKPTFDMIGENRCNWLERVEACS